ncbi:hypothetical protein ACSLGF_06825 [Bacillus sp. A015]
MIENNKRWFWYSLMFILIFNIIFQFSTYEKIIQMFLSIEGDVPTIDKDILRWIVISLQMFSVFTNIIEVLIGGLILFFVAFLLGSKKPKKTYMLIYALTTALFTFKLIILSIFNFLSDEKLNAYTLDRYGLLLHILDPFLVISIIFLYSLIRRLTDLDNIKRLIFLSIFTVMKLSVLLINYYLN